MNMRAFGYIRVAAAMPVVHVADTVANAEEIIRLSEEISARKASIIAFPELSVTGYTCADLLGQQSLIAAAEEASRTIVECTSKLNAMLVFGAPIRYKGRLYNCAVASRAGKILGIVPKTYLAGNGEFYEPRWFESSRFLPTDGVRIDFAGRKDILFGVHQLFKIGDALCGIELCQDLWSPVPPCTWAALAGAHIIINLSASNEVLLKNYYRKTLVSSTSSRIMAAYVYCTCGYGESTQDLVWAGASLIYENGSLICENRRFQYKPSYILGDIDIERIETLRAREHTYNFEGPATKFIESDAGEPADTDFEAELLRDVDALPFVPQGDEKTIATRCSEIVECQASGLMTRMEHINCRKAVIGISGGLDSTLALIVTVLAFDRLGWSRENIIGVTMPGFGTSSRTYNNAKELMRLFGITQKEISIVKATKQHFQDIGQSEDTHDLTYENSQARERTQILMDLAGREGALVIGTGDLSELALGWCTYNGDHMSMYGVNVSVAKTQVRVLVKWAAERLFDENTGKILLDIVNTPISPELTPADEKGKMKQFTEDIIGPYELHDFFLYNFFRFGYSEEKMVFLVRKAFGGKYDEKTISQCLYTFMKRFYSQQFKRSCLPDGPKVGTVSLSPRGDWRMPSDVAYIKK